MRFRAGRPPWLQRLGGSLAVMVEPSAKKANKRKTKRLSALSLPYKSKTLILSERLWDHKTISLQRNQGLSAFQVAAWPKVLM